MKEIELEQLERWMIRRTQQTKKTAQSTMGKNGRKTSLSRYLKTIEDTNSRSIVIYSNHQFQMHIKCFNIQNRAQMIDMFENFSYTILKRFIVLSVMLIKFSNILTIVNFPAIYPFLFFELLFY